VNDVVTKLNDQQIDQQHPLQSLLLRFRPGDKVRLAIIRGSETTTIELTLGARPS
jgi:S1-C subfamily serine protease